MRLLFLLLIVTLLTYCGPKTPDLKEHLDGWEHLITYRILPSKTIIIVEKRANIAPGDMNVLIVQLDTKPIFKKGHENITDLGGRKCLFIEIDPSDTLVSPENLGRSRILREILAMSPDYGTNNIGADEKIEITKSGVNRWTIFSEIEDFQFQGDFNFTDSSTSTFTYNTLYR